MPICTKIRGLIDIRKQNMRLLSQKMGYKQDSLSTMLGHMEESARKGINWKSWAGKQGGP